MAIIDYLINEEVVAEAIAEDGEIQTEPISEEGTGEGDYKAIVDALIQNAPGQSEAIEAMLKYAANSNPEHNIWDNALDYFESRADEVSSVDDELKADEEPEADEEIPLDDTEGEEEIPVDEPTDEPAGDEEEDEFDLEM